MKKIFGILLLLALFLGEKAQAQQVPMYGQYIFNNSVINPAQAGVRDKNQWGVLGRYQWVGVDGAPTTHTAFFNFRLPANLGLAVGIYQDNIGPVRDFTLQTDVAYHAQISENWYLSGGLRLLTSSIKVNLLDLENVDHNDPYFNQNLSSGLHFNVGAGLVAFSEKTFFGVSLPKAQRKGFGDKNNEVNMVSRHLFVYGGNTFDLSDNFVVTPSALFKTSEKAPSQIDINAIFGYNEIFDFGPMLRSNFTESWMDAVGFLVGIHLTENWYFGYMFEYPTNDMNLVTRQTHEVSLRYLWGSKEQIHIRSPRYFL
ncbi:MAG: type IX secretion system membrane protein PorP/SprF [Bacteroides sp.]|jgi:type IX secretion system PorP/SprF family membrane protein|nr:type IX secretion system membrane protein PorP/SprF [Bacteroides sp.]